MSASGPAGRTTCPACGQDVAITRDRRIRSHGNPKCAGQIGRAS